MRALPSDAPSSPANELAWKAKMKGMTRIEIRPARPDEFEAIAGLRWRWVTERDGLPGAGREEYVRKFAVWAREHAATHRRPATAGSAAC